MDLRKTSLLAAALCLGSTTAMAQVKVTNGMLTDGKGMTLYVFDNDSGGKSACTGGCATIWPPVMADDSAKLGANYSTITRDDGKKQVAYKGKPLYAWTNDKKPGDTTGDNFNKVWHVARP